MSFSNRIKVKSELEEALSNIESNENNRMVLAHVTSYKYLNAIFTNRFIKPEMCKVLQEKVVYLSYGAPFYKRSTHYTQDIGEFPIVIIFRIQVHKLINCYFPFDSGAAHDRKFGKKWECLSDIYRFHIRDNPEKIISAFYGSNEDYVCGRVLKNNNYKKIIAKLNSFLSDDLTPLDIDERQNTIECVTRKKIPVTKKVLWMAYPDNYLGTDLLKKIDEIWSVNPEKFDTYPYPVSAGKASPAELLTGVKMKFLDDYKYLYKAPGGTV